MRKALAILLFSVISYHCVLKLGIVAWYEYNKNYIAQTLCENRDKPQMKCCGKCYLRKQLAKADAKNQQGKPLPEQLSKMEVPPFLVPEAPMIGGRYCYAERQRFYYQHSIPEEVSLSIFQPPG